MSNIKSILIPDLKILFHLINNMIILFDLTTYYSCPFTCSYFAITNRKKLISSDYYKN